MVRKSKQFIDEFLDVNGNSKIIKRYDLPSEFAYTSGDSIFRSDAQLGRIYKFFRFSKTLNFNKCSRCWKLTEEDKLMLKNIHNTLEFTKNNPMTVEYIEFFGKCKIPLKVILLIIILENKLEKCRV